MAKDFYGTRPNGKLKTCLINALAVQDRLLTNGRNVAQSILGGRAKPSVFGH